MLAQPVLAWRASHEAERELQRQQDAADRRHRRLLAIIGAAAVLLVAMGGVTLYALSQRSEARQQALEAKANGLIVNADAELDRDPELSLLLALEAARRVSGERVERSVQRALLTSRVRGIAELGAPVLDAVEHGGAVVAVTEEGEIVEVTPGTGDVVDTISTGSAAKDASFAADRTVVITGRDGRVRIVRPGGEVTVVPGVTDALAASSSRDGSVVAVVEPNRVRLDRTPNGPTPSCLPPPRRALGSHLSR